MKKVKIMLMAVATFAVVGGALAFKAKNNFAGNLYCTSTFGLPVTTTQRFLVHNPGITSYCITTNQYAVTTTGILTLTVQVNP